MDAAIDLKLLEQDNRRIQEEIYKMGELSSVFQTSLEREIEMDQITRRQVLHAMAHNEDLEISLESLKASLEQEILYFWRSFLSWVCDLSAEQTKLNEFLQKKKDVEGQLMSKKAELHRNEKRLFALNAVRSSYMDEYENLQSEIQSL